MGQGIVSVCVVMVCKMCVRRGLWKFLCERMCCEMDILQLKVVL